MGLKEVVSFVMALYLAIKLNIDIMDVDNFMSLIKFMAILIIVYLSLSAVELMIKKAFLVLVRKIIKYLRS